MLHWCSVYPSVGSFERYYIEWNSNDYAGDIRAKFQFETERPAILFKLKFGDQ
jgi:hypothetical protein